MRSKATDCQRCHGRSRHQAGECQSRNIPKYLPMSSDLNKKGPSNWQHTREETFYSSKHLPEQSGKEYQRALDSPKGKNFVIWSHFHHLSTSGAGVSEKTLCRHESWSTRALGELFMTLVNWRFKKREHLVQSKFCLQIRRKVSELERKRCFAPVSTSPW